MLAGVDEDLLSRVPPERSWYTGVGGVVLGTAVIAGFSMWFAVSQAIGFTHILVTVPALIWALFILNLDRWLVSRPLVSGWYRRVPALLMRLVVALFLGVVIAEPLVMRIFETAIEEHVRNGRIDAQAEVRGRLLACNPGRAEGAPPVDCDRERDLLSFERDPAATAAELAERESDSDRLRQTIEADRTELLRINDLARRECVGESGAGLTGIPGVGPNCDRLRREADEFRQTHRIAEKESQLSALEGRVDSLRDDLRTAEEDFQGERDALIAAEVGKLVDPQDRIGFLERLEALHALAATAPSLFAGTWAVRFFFILIDCLPILIKIFGGHTTYDELVESRLAAGKRWYEGELAIETDRREREASSRQAESDIQAREHAATLRIRLAEAVNRLAEQYSQRPAPNGRHHGGPADDLLDLQP